MFNLTWSPGVTLEAIERHAIEQAYRFYQGNKVQTARALDIAVRTLETKLEKYRNDDARTTADNEERRRKDADFQRRQRGLPSLEPVADVKASDAAEGDLGEEASQGVRMEPAQDSSEKSAMSMPVGKKVQGMPSAHASADRSRKAR